jgi:hypothetical protein
MKNISTGFGLCVLGLGIAAWSVLDRLAPTANASAVSAAVSAVSTAANGQTGPTILWYGTSQGDNYNINIYRAWSDGRFEGLAVERLFTSCQPSAITLRACGGWQVLSVSSAGYSSASDINFDAKVDGADLGQLLADWGDAPRQDIPPSDCPLALINP